MKNFAIIGVGGYIAPRHLKAIKDTDNSLVAATDPFDSVGILDRYFYEVDYFKEFERFDRHIEKLRRKSDAAAVDYVSICSPNYLHDAHIRFALRVGADAICEKPLVLNPWNIDGLAEIEEETQNKIYNILQLRVHPSIMKLREKVLNSDKKDKYDIDLTYITSRGKWYYYSWKGSSQKSGGVATNIGIHFFDMLTWIFGDVQTNDVHVLEEKKAGGFLELENANVRWFLSLDKDDLPQQAVEAGKPTYRSIQVEGEEIEFSGGFTDLHTVVYQGILNGNGYGIKDAYTSVKIAHDIRHATPIGVDQVKSHPLLLRSKK